MKGKSLQEFGRLLGLSCQRTTPIKGFAIDSRLIKEGEVFFALPGEKVHGEFFLQQVAGRGAIGAVVSKDYRGNAFGLELFPVDDVKESLHFLAKESFAKRDEKVIAVTGSMGKTTTKEFIATLLSAKFRVFKTPDSYNSQLTVPLILLNLDSEPHDLLVLEMAMSVKGQIEKLVRLAPPDIAVLTRVAPASIASFEDGLEGVADAKAEIFSHPKTLLGIISAQAAKYDQVLYGGTCAKLIYGEGVDDEFPLPFSASHLKENFLAALAVAKELGLSKKEIMSKCRELKPFKRRFEMIKKDGVTFIQDCYNSNPDSLKAALENLPQSEGKRIGVLGTMPDLGSLSTKYHHEMGQFASEHLDKALCIGEEMKDFAEAFQNDASFFSSTASVKEYLFSSIKPGDVVLIKGGNYLKLWEILEG